MKTRTRPCPCGRPATYAACCGRLIAGDTVAADAESLMRSRYSAYCQGEADYLRATWHPSTRPETLDLTDGPRWTGLSVESAVATGPTTATVEFVARYRSGGRPGQIHERSRFVHEDGRWFYVDGDILGD
ncbi:YchJ family protein [Denitromonas iodatirespirans]|uniref:UPF0225 protein I8J34_06520 n=1 Tax=Denitromonas iodatirespirans TaxID=2795389 RepID=A0A944DDL3_DENI1|nr:YchJ family metal-binding protein [Denitromonas iodatirespirans]MBT0960828.1 hypothetical protein [Denitromonas iodatirespirans]